MNTRPYYDSPTAVMLREMHAASGLSWRALADVLGYHHTTVFNASSGRDRAGAALVQDVASLHAEMVAA